MRSPNWNDDELKLALELYLSKDMTWLSRISDSTTEIVALSQLLNILDFYPDPKPDKFRSVGSVRMKLANFKAVDSRYGKSALSNIASGDRRIWNLYHENYDMLFSECKMIVKKHVTGAMSEEVISYLKRYKASEDEKNDFFLFAKEVYKGAEQFRETALKDENLELSQKIVNSCFEIMKALEWCNIKKDDTPRLKDERNTHVHCGVNQVPIDGAEVKIGKFVQNTMSQLINDGCITKHVLSELTDKEWSREVLHLSHPFLIKIDPDLDIKPQLRDANGYLRYWKDRYFIQDEWYCICKEWFESGRRYYVAWLNTISSKQALDVSVTNLIELLKYIKDTDEQAVSIRREELYSHISSTSKVHVLEELIRMGVLAPFQGTERELVVEDYDLLYEMLSRPEKYIKEK